MPEHEAALMVATETCISIISLPYAYGDLLINFSVCNFRHDAALRLFFDPVFIE